MENLICTFEKHLIQEERSSVTIEKYMRDVKKFFEFVGTQNVTKDVVINYKRFLIKSGYAVRSINSMLASLNSFLAYSGLGDCRVKSMKTQKQIYCKEDKELTKAEYIRLLSTAKKQPRLYYVMQTICGTGIRVSELSYFNVEAVQRGGSWFPVKTRPGRFFYQESCKRNYCNMQSNVESHQVLYSGQKVERHWTEATYGLR